MAKCHSRRKPPCYQYFNQEQIQSVEAGPKDARKAQSGNPQILKDIFIKSLVDRISEMNTALVRLKVEMEAISHAELDYQVLQDHERCFCVYQRNF